MVMAVGSSPSCPGVSSGLAMLYLGSNDARDGRGFQCHFVAFLWHSGSHVISSGSKMACSSTLLLYISGCA